MVVRGRPPTTSREAVSRTAFELFANQGFDAVTMNDIAGALGIGRRTLFRYFDSKNDLVWGDFEQVLDRLRADLDATDPRLPLTEALTEAVIASNIYPDDEQAELRVRMTLISTVPALQGHSMLRYEAWRDVVAEFAGRRLSLEPSDLAAQGIANAALAASISAFARWVEHDDEDLVDLLRRSYGMLAAGFDLEVIAGPASGARDR